MFVFVGGDVCDWGPCARDYTAMHHPHMYLTQSGRGPGDYMILFFALCIPSIPGVLGKLYDFVEEVQGCPFPQYLRIIDHAIHNQVQEVLHAQVGHFQLKFFSNQ